MDLQAEKIALTNRFQQLIAHMQELQNEAQEVRGMLKLIDRLLVDPPLTPTERALVDKIAPLSDGAGNAQLSPEDAAKFAAEIRDLQPDP